MPVGLAMEGSVPCVDVPVSICLVSKDVNVPEKM